MGARFLCGSSRLLAIGVVTAFGAVAAFAASHPAAEATAPAAGARWLAVEPSGAGLLFRKLPAGGRIAVRVTGPGDFLFETSSAEGEEAVVVFEPGSLPDGSYKYEVRDLPPATRTRTESAAGGSAAVADARVLSGRFMVRGLAITLPSSAPESPAAAAKAAAAGAGDAPVAADPLPEALVLNGDAVVRDNLCVGFDCPDAPSFSDSSILIMDVNTRIKFGDTSADPFTTRDWEIEANSSLSGGASYLGFNDCGTSSDGGGCAANLVFAVEAGARASALYVEEDGDVGLGTSNPTLDLDIVTGNTPGVRFDQDGTSGFAPQVWDVAGNETNFFVRDATNGSLLPLRIQPMAPTNSIFIASGGNVGIGTASPVAPVDIVRNGGTNAAFRIQNTGFGGGVPSAWYFSNQAANGAFIISPTGGAAPFKVFTDATQNSIVVGSKEGSGAQVVGIHKVNNLTFPLEVGTNATDGNGAHVTAAGVWTNGSSRKNKTDVHPLSGEEAIAALDGLTPVLYRGKGSPDNEQYVGFIAEDVPALVAQNDRESLSPMDIVAVLTRALQVERRKNQELEARLARLEALLEPQPQQ